MKKPIFKLKIMYLDSNGVTCSSVFEFETSHAEQELIDNLNGPGDFFFVPTNGTFIKLGRKAIRKNDILAVETVPTDPNCTTTPQKIKFGLYAGPDKIKAIKAVRDVADLSLREAKDIIELGSSNWWKIHTSIFKPDQLDYLGIQYELS